MSIDDEVRTKFINWILENRRQEDGSCPIGKNIRQVIFDIRDENRQCPIEDYATMTDLKFCLVPHIECPYLSQKKIYVNNNFEGICDLSTYLCNYRGRNDERIKK